MINSIDDLVAQVAKNFRSFAPTDVDEIVSNDPVVHTLKKRPPFFALGVDIKDVVLFVYNKVLEDIIGPVTELPLVTTIEIQDDTGSPASITWGLKGVSIALEDDGRTLKVFVK